MAQAAAAQTTAPVQAPQVPPAAPAPAYGYDPNAAYAASYPVYSDYSVGYPYYTYPYYSYPYSWYSYSYPWGCYSPFYFGFYGHRFHDFDRYHGFNRFDRFHGGFAGRGAWAPVGRSFAYRGGFGSPGFGGRSFAGGGYRSGGLARPGGFGGHSVAMGGHGGGGFGGHGGGGHR